MRPTTSLRAGRAAGNIPEFLAVIKVERNHCTGGLRCLHSLNHYFRGGRRERRKNPAAVEPSHTPAKNGVPIEISRLEASGSFVRAVVKDDRRAHTKAAIAIYRRHVRAGDAVVGEVLVERPNSHRPDSFGDQIPDGIIHHRGDDAGLQTETVRHIRGYIKLAAADMNLALSSLAKGDAPRIQTVYESAERQEVQRAVLAYLKGFVHFAIRSFPRDPLYFIRPTEVSPFLCKFSRTCFWS